MTTLSPHFIVSMLSLYANQTHLIVVKKEEAMSYA
ncbi:hypothetical protein AQULUS_05820 [Aquicella lusitana]|uniref:Uncharacterized protein n=1 Tax=Aquicella lusitana TaxID=254246 RepID=A0A370GXX0_9COXI|nr:hypothetical protein C8D86_10391 [Aquicella lusitana]VVC72858.1 hypothetical protein AQULUS_05820 [Aquicella lusitana]